MDAETVAIYEANADRWAARRGVAGDELAAAFRSRVGASLVLDAGCGAGRYLGQLGADAVGLDAAVAMLGLARRSQTPLVGGDLERLPFRTGVFAGVFARHSYLHLPKDRLVPALGEARRVLRLGGLILVSMISGGSQGRQLPGDDFPGRWFSLWGEAELLDAISAAGFDAVTAVVYERGWGDPDIVVTASWPR